VRGFGALPLHEHVAAPWACWAVRFVRGMVLLGAARPPWLGVLDTFLRGVHPTYTPCACSRPAQGYPGLGMGYCHQI